MADPVETSPSPPASGTVALAVCFARTLHQRDGKFLQALQSEIAAMLQEPVTPEVAKVLYAFSVALDDSQAFPPA